MGARLKLSRRSALVLFLFAFTGAAAATAPVSVHVVETDLKPLIRAAYLTPVQFAVLVPIAASTARDGSWSVTGDLATWRYAVQVPTAVSLSFHASQSALPASATLVVSGTKTTTSYHARDLRRGELWSRIHPGDALQLTITVAAADRSKVALKIVSLQAGYRSVGSGVEDHPYYRQLKAQLDAATGNASCVTNYECDVTAGNTPLGFATVALVIGNLYQCSGSLINDVPQDGTPYVLTARHCETGQLGGGNPGAASEITVYWDATSGCGTLGSLYDAGIVTQTGAETVVEQQDAWLVRLDDSPAVSNAQLAGFDASGGAVQGGYTIHHAEGYDKQFVQWYDQALVLQESGVLGTSYVSNLLETVNQLGNIGPGASGSGLFDQNNHLVGSLSLGRTTSDPSGYGACPVAPLTAPNGSNGVADFTSLFAVWSSTADTTSSTGAATLKSVLDPANTGTLVVSSIPTAFVELTASTYVVSIGQPATLTWSGLGATQCTAGGGAAGDGWTGTLAASGSRALTEGSASLVTYSVQCTYPGGRTAKATTTISWEGPTPEVQLTGPSSGVWTTTPATLSWTSNVGPCSLGGGGLALSNLAASGSVETTQSTPGDVIYTLTCGPINQNASTTVTVGYVTPSLVLSANGDDRLLGQTFFLIWTTAASACTPSGGSPNDGWANTQFTGFFATSQEPFYLTETTPGTYTYTLTCSTGPLSVTQSVTVRFENATNPSSLTMSLSPASVTYSDSPADYATLTWSTNLTNCSFGSNPPDVVITGGQSGAYAQGVYSLAPSQSGTFQIAGQCYPSSGTTNSPASAATTFTVLPPPAPVPKITFSATTVAAGESFTAGWSASDSGVCLLTGGIPGGFWGGSVQQVPAPGSAMESGPAGKYTFGLTCYSIDPATPAVSTQSSLTITPLTATLAASTTSVTQGQSFTLTWSSVGASGCSASGGGATGAPWTGSLGPSGNVTQTASAVGSFVYSLACTAGNASTPAQQVTVNVAAASTGGGGGGGGGGKGGGGAIDLLELASLAALLGLRRRRAALGTRAPVGK